MKKALIILSVLTQIGCVENDKANLPDSLTVIVDGPAKVRQVILGVFVNKDCTEAAPGMLTADQNPAAVVDNKATFTGLNYQDTKKGNAIGTFYLKVASENDSVCAHPNKTIVLTTSAVAEAPALAPKSPVALSPAGYFINPSPVFSWTGDARTVKYQFKIVVTETNQLVYEDNEVTGTSFTLPGAINIDCGIKYTWKVRSVFSDGSMSAYSNYWDIMLFDPNFIPAPQYPRANISTTLPAFTWSPVAGAAKYEIEIIERDTNRQILVMGDLESNNFSLGITLDLDKVYHWRVRAFDSSGKSSRWSDWLSFLCYDDDFARSVTPTWPSGAIATTRPEFAWTPATDVFAYEIEVRDVSGHIVYQASSPIPVMTLVSNFQIANGGKYSWQVRTINQRLQVSAWSAAVSFQVILN